ncbi:MAG: hypothetical protein VR70_04040 [Rhodospirillaceae bacterium BRH_c57]|nr:MAG: hypothetical protein VR70_04040 [Rhodospirillaceae bacterium BRH_c57]
MDIGGRKRHSAEEQIADLQSQMDANFAKYAKFNLENKSRGSLSQSDLALQMDIVRGLSEGRGERMFQKMSMVLGRVADGLKTGDRGRDGKIDKLATSLSAQADFKMSVAQRFSEGREGLTPKQQKVAEAFIKMQFGDMADAAERLGAASRGVFRFPEARDEKSKEVIDEVRSDKSLQGFLISTFRNSGSDVAQNLGIDNSKDEGRKLANVIGAAGSLMPSLGEDGVKMDVEAGRAARDMLGWKKSGDEQGMTRDHAMMMSLMPDDRRAYSRLEGLREHALKAYDHSLDMTARGQGSLRLAAKAYDGATDSRDRLVKGFESHIEKMKKAGHSEAASDLAKAVEMANRGNLFSGANALVSGVMKHGDKLDKGLHVEAGKLAIGTMRAFQHFDKVAKGFCESGKLDADDASLIHGRLAAFEAMASLSKKMGDKAFDRDMRALSVPVGDRDDNRYRVIDDVRSLSRMLNEASMGRVNEIRPKEAVRLADAVNQSVSMLAKGFSGDMGAVMKRLPQGADSLLMQAADKAHREYQNAHSEIFDATDPAFKSLGEAIRRHDPEGVRDTLLSPSLRQVGGAIMLDIKQKSLDASVGDLQNSEDPRAREAGQAISNWIDGVQKRAIENRDSRNGELGIVLDQAERAGREFPDNESVARLATLRTRWSEANTAIDRIAGGSAQSAEALKLKAEGRTPDAASTNDWNVERARQVAIQASVEKAIREELLKIVLDDGKKGFRKAFLHNLQNELEQYKGGPTPTLALGSTYSAFNGKAAYEAVETLSNSLSDAIRTLDTSRRETYEAAVVGLAAHAAFDKGLEGLRSDEKLGDEYDRHRAVEEAVSGLSRNKVAEENAERGGSLHDYEGKLATVGKHDVRGEVANLASTRVGKLSREGDLPTRTVEKGIEASLETLAKGRSMMAAAALSQKTAIDRSFGNHRQYAEVEKVRLDLLVDRLKLERDLQRMERQTEAIGKIRKAEEGIKAEFARVKPDRVVESLRKRAKAEAAKAREIEVTLDKMDSVAGSRLLGRIRDRIAPFASQIPVVGKSFKVFDLQRATLVVTLEQRKADSAKLARLAKETEAARKANKPPPYEAVPYATNLTWKQRACSSIEEQIAKLDALYGANRDVIQGSVRSASGVSDLFRDAGSLADFRRKLKGMLRKSDGAEQTVEAYTRALGMIGQYADNLETALTDIRVEKERLIAKADALIGDAEARKQAAVEDENLAWVQAA